MTDSTAWGVAGGKAGRARQRQNQRIINNNKKDVLGPYKSLALHELIVRIDHF